MVCSTQPRQRRQRRRHEVGPGKREYSFFELVPAGPGMLQDVADDHVDVGVAPTAVAKTEGLCSAGLVSLDWVVYARAEHPAVRSWNAKAWASYPHIRVRTASGKESPVDALARKLKLSRRSGPYLPHFMLAPPLLARTDLLMTVPRAVLADVAPRFGLVALPCPVKIAPIELSMFWSAQRDRDPAVVWFRQVLHEAASEAFASPKSTPRTARERSPRS